MISSPVVLLIPYGRRARKVGCRTSGREEQEQTMWGHERIGTRTDAQGTQ